MTTVTYLRPYLEPYYDTYAAPYVEIARPYAQQLDQKVIIPASEIAKHNYYTHAAPRIEQAKALGQRQWQKTILPQVQTAQNRVEAIYGASVAPHVEKASSIAEPYYRVAKNNALNLHQTFVMPALETSRPYVLHAYNAAHAFLLDTGMPYANWAWSSMIIFIDGTLWPQVRALYGDNVRPQLMMISERIAKYQEGRRLKASMEKVESSISAASEATSESTITATPEIVPETPTPAEEQAPAKTSLTGQEQIAAARDRIASDLHTWQNKFAKAADKGSEDLDERVKDIISRLIKSEVDGEGRGLLTALNLTVEKEMAGFKSKVIKAVSSLSDESSTSEEDAAEQELQEAIRRCANSIRDRASAVRKWHTKFQTLTTQRAEAAADSTVDILNGIRDLGLQEIGMRWAWMDGVTHKDWRKYHDLKKQFDSWRDEVREVATKHEILQEAKKASDAILEDAMETASDAAMELVRLKDVAKWKIRARDATENFESRAMPAAAASAGSKVADKIDDASQTIVGGSQDTMQSIVEKGSDAASVASSAILGSSQGTMESVASRATQAAADMASSASSAVAGSSQNAAESIISEATRSAASMASDASSAVIGESSSGALDNAAESVQSVTSQVGDSATSAAESVASAASQVEHAASSGAENAASSASSIASSASSRVYGGAMAQKVSSRTPILDDIVDDSDDTAFSEKVQSVINDAGDRYADVTRAVGEALLGPSQGTMESMSSIASEQYASALAAASSVLYGTTQGTAESITSIASERYSQAVSA